MSSAVRLGRGIQAGALAVVLLAQGCAVTGGGYDEGYGGGYGGDYYEVEGGGYADYGGWGHGYRGGPPRGGAPRGPSAARGFRPAAAGRPTPSVPSHARR